MESTINILSVSGGKDSTAMWLLALERETANIIAVFADTGHEHAITYDYIDYLKNKLGKIICVKADFAAQVEHKRHVVQTKWREDGINEDVIQAALRVLKPTGNPFLDLCLWKGRFPSTKRRFCSEELKHHPIDKQVIDPALDEYDEVINWQGIRADESFGRSKLSEREDHPTKDGLVFYRPLLKWSAKDVFAIIKRHGLKPNPLYRQGMGRVGCMPCIHSRKLEVREIAKRFPKEIERVAEWERIVSIASKRGASTFMNARVVNSVLQAKNHEISAKTHGINAYVEWSKTDYGGQQYNLFSSTDEPTTCMSIYGLCE